MNIEDRAAGPLGPAHNRFWIENEMHSEFETLLSPLSFHGRVLRNRIVSTAHNINWENNGLISRRHIEYQVRKGRGGAGLIMCFGGANVFEPAASNDDSASLWDSRNEPALTEIADRIHASGALVMAQASHLGLRAVSYINGKPAQAPSAVSLPRKENPVPLTVPEIRAIVEAFATAAARLERCGWDGVEITSFGCHLLEQFWSPLLNRREDEYGGSAENRARITVEVIEAVARAVSPRFIVAFRLTGNPLTPEVGLTPADMVELATRVDAVGRVDFLNVTAGSGASPTAQASQIPSDVFPEGVYVDYAATIRGQVRAKVLSAGRIHDPEMAEAILRDGKADLVAMTRSLIADPDLPSKLTSGARHLVRPCIAINDACIGRAYQGYPMKCAVNPGIGDGELDDDALPKGDVRGSAVVIGGGPAGLAAARTAALIGMDVKLFDKGANLGGQLLSAWKAKDRPRIGLHIEWLERELERLGVEVHREREISADEVLSEGADAVIVASGADTVLPREAQSFAVSLATDVDVLDGRTDWKGKKTIVVYDRDGTIRGGGVALMLREAGHDVSLYTPLAYVGANLDPTQQPIMMRRLVKAGVALSTDLFIESSNDGAPSFRNGWTNEIDRHDCDALVAVGYRIPRSTLHAELSGRLPSTAWMTLVGDARAPRRLYDAVAEGTQAGRDLLSRMTPHGIRSR